jgi:hypothetical protein
MQRFSTQGTDDQKMTKRNNSYQTLMKNSLGLILL